jgi:PKD repeat protein
MKKDILVIATIGILLASCFVITPLAEPEQHAPPIGTILYVGGIGSGNYSSIQDAIDNASDGYTIYVYSGIYYENIVIYKSINLTGENIKTTIIYGNGIDDVIKVTADYVNISGFTIRQPGPINSVLKYCYPQTSLQYFDITASSLDNFNVRFSPESFCKLEECSLMLYIEDESWINTTEGIEVIVWDDDGFGYPDNELARVQVPASQINLYPNYTYVDLSYLNLVFNGDFHIGYSMVNQAEDYYAILFDDVNHSESRSSVYYDGAWYNLSDIIYENNNFNITAYITYSGVGVNLSQTNNSVLKNNIITKCNQGVVSYGYLSSESKYQTNLIYHNNFVDNTQNAYDSTTNNWDNGTQGNYWDDYIGEDNDGDGIGDTPYSISGGGNQDHYPLMYPLGESGIDIKIKLELPANGSTGVNINQSTVSAYISALAYHTSGNETSAALIPFNWTIEGQYVSPNGTNKDTAGRKTANLTTPLPYSTEIIWYVNVTAGGVQRNEVFRFTTQEPPNQPPVANFTSIVRDLTLFFNASPSSDNDGTITAYDWDFGDNTTGTGKLTNHTYATDGTYNVTLTVTDDDGATDSVTKEIVVINNPPVANFSYAIVGGTTHVRFDASASYDKNGTIVSYFWEFGDGTNATDTDPFIDHTYPRDNAIYKINLTVTDSAGLTNTTSELVTFPDMKGPTIKIDQPIRGLYIKDKLIRKFLIRPALIIGDITIKINASDSGSGIKYVELWIGKELKINSTTGQFNYTWHRDRLRLIHLFRIKVVAYDNEGNSATKTMIVRKYL